MERHRPDGSRIGLVLIYVTGPAVGQDLGILPRILIVQTGHVFPLSVDIYQLQLQSYACPFPITFFLLQ